MRERKNIDRLYQEKFRDFEAYPREEVWKSISAKLREEKNTPKLLPLWYRIAGVAALLALLFSAFDWLSPITEPTQFVNQQPQEIKLPSVQKPDTQIVISEEKQLSTKPIPEQNLTASVEKRERQAIASLEIEKKNAIFEKYIPQYIPGFKNETAVATPEVELDLFIDQLAVQEKTEVAVASSKNNFEISTRAAPIYYGNMGKDNFLDSRFNNKNSEADVTYSYGVMVAYNISDKIKLRSGVTKINMSYNTKGVGYQAVAGMAPMNIKVLENASMAVINPESPNVRRKHQASSGDIKTMMKPGNLNQRMGYIEVPLEVEYNLFANKFELNLIGGASTLFLDENEIMLQSPSVTASGKADNINNISFSTNIGIGLDYNLSEKFKLNLEPMLKYQLNTFQSNTGNAQPYYFGIYSGFSYKF